jgi:diacylglycerol kinase
MRRFLKSFGYSFEGIAHAFKFEPNFRFHLIALIVVGSTGWYFKLSSSEWLWIAAVSGIVIMAELFNTAIEVLVDLVSPEIHPKAKIVKDLASAAVLIAAILAAITGLIILIPKI